MRRSILKTVFFVAVAISSLNALGIPTPHRSALLKAPLRLKNWGLTNTEAPSHIHAVDAWKIEEGSRSVVVAVIDTGIDPNHKNLSSNIWHDRREKHSSIFGWNFVSDRPNPLDEHGHGTHVAGIIGAMTDSQSGVAGVAHQVSIMPVKYYSEANTGVINLRNTVKAINYAVDHGAKIINYSGGGPEFSEEEYLAIKKAEARGVLFVAAAGNEHQNTDLLENYYYPSAYRLSNIISVAATDIHNNLLPSSNWGKKSVDVAAPGENIYSTLPGGRYGYMSGTSQGTAFVTGVAALLLSNDPTLTPAEIREIINQSADRITKLSDRLASGGRINAYGALIALKNRKYKNNKTRPSIIAQRPGSLLNTIVAPEFIFQSGAQ
ncbi:MAG: S8 family peptidase [Bdellovibrionota bacterium]